MGANGSHSSNALLTEENRQYVTIGSISDNVKILAQKDRRRNGKLPEESHTPNRTYVSFLSDGKDVKEIAHYGNDCKKQYVIHTSNHKGLSPHYHLWKDGRQQENAYPLTPEMRQLLEYVRNCGNN